MDFSIDFDLDRRSYFRVEPSADAPVIFRAGGHDFKVADLSAGGMALFQSSLPEGRRLRGELWLPDLAGPIHMSLLIIRSGPERVTSCNIAEISEADREKLHQYVLKRQKEHLEEQKQQAAKEADPAKKPL